MPRDIEGIEADAQDQNVWDQIVLMRDLSACQEFMEGGPMETCIDCLWPEEKHQQESPIMAAIKHDGDPT